MKKNKILRFFVIFTFILGCMGLFLGLMTLSNTLAILTNRDIFEMDPSFGVAFFSSVNNFDKNSINPEYSFSTAVKPTNFQADMAFIDNTKEPTIGNLNVNFTGPGQGVTYTFYTKNIGKMKAFLKSVTFSGLDNDGSFKRCILSSSQHLSNVNYVDNLCENIHIEIIIGSEATAETFKSGSVVLKKNHTLEVDGYEKIVIKIAFDGDDEANGGCSVSFGNISLIYSPVD